MLDGFESHPAAPFVLMTKPPKRTATKPAATLELPDQVERLKLLRAMLGYETSTAFAAFLGIGLQRYNAFENSSPLTRDVAFLIVQRVPGLTLDWLFFGKADGLPLELARNLGVFPQPGK